MTSGRLRPSVPAASDAERKLEGVLGARVFVPVTIPRTEVKGDMRLVSRDEGMAIIAEARQFFAERKLKVDPEGLGVPGVINEWNCEIAVRHLAVAVRDPSDRTKQLAPIEEWRDDCDDEQISALWQEYQDLRERLDPLATLENLTESELIAMRSAVKKKEHSLLMSFGSRRLASLLLTTDEVLAS